MLGDEKKVGTDELFHYFKVEELIPANRLLRRIDAVLDTSWVRQEVAEAYSKGGRPSWDPEVIVRMILLGVPLQPVRGPPGRRAPDAHGFQVVLPAAALRSDSGSDHPRQAAQPEVEDGPLGEAPRPHGAAVCRGRFCFGPPRQHRRHEDQGQRLARQPRAHRAPDLIAGVPPDQCQLGTIRSRRG